MPHAPVTIKLWRSAIHAQVPSVRTCCRLSRRGWVKSTASRVAGWRSLAVRSRRSSLRCSRAAHSASTRRPNAPRRRGRPPRRYAHWREPPPPESALAAIALRTGSWPSWKVRDYADRRRRSCSRRLRRYRHNPDIGIMGLTALDQRERPVNVRDGPAHRLSAIHQEQHRPVRRQPPRHQVVEQPGGDRGRLGRAFTKAEHVLAALGIDPQRDHDAVVARDLCRRCTRPAGPTRPADG